MRTNEDKLVMISVEGEITNPMIPRGVYDITHEGKPVVLPGVGGITYNVKLGDPAVGWVADHVEPGVSTSNLKKHNSGPSPNVAYNVLSCIGNKGRVIQGEAKGSEGVVVGKHGGIEHVLIDFEQAVIEKLNIGDRIQIRAFGTGLQLLDYEDVKLFNTSPELLKRLGVKDRSGKLEVPVTHIVPAYIMGSGLGANTCHRGDYDIQLFDKKTVRKYNLGTLRFGDIIAIQDADHSYGRIYKEGMVSIGVVVHSDCVISGHGPGVTSLMTGSGKVITPKITATANLKRILRLPVKHLRRAPAPR